MQDLVIMEIKPQYKENMSGKTDIRRLTKELRKDFENPYYCLLGWNNEGRFVFGLIKVTRDFASEIEPYIFF